MSSMTQVPDTGPQAVASKVLNGLHGVDGPKVLVSVPFFVPHLLLAPVRVKSFEVVDDISTDVLPAVKSQRAKPVHKQSFIKSIVTFITEGDDVLLDPHSALRPAHHMTVGTARSTAEDTGCRAVGTVSFGHSSLYLRRYGCCPSLTMHVPIPPS